MGLTGVSARAARVHRLTGEPTAAASAIIDARRRKTAPREGAASAGRQVRSVGAAAAAFRAGRFANTAFLLLGKDMPSARHVIAPSGGFRLLGLRFSCGFGVLSSTKRARRGSHVRQRGTPVDQRVPRGATPVSLTGGIGGVSAGEFSSKQAGSAAKAGQSLNKGF